MAADISIEAEMLRMFATAAQSFGAVTALLNNAGILEKQMRIDEIDAGRLARIFTANILSAFLCSEDAVGRMLTKHASKGGAIVNISSVAARLGSPGEYIDYAAAKGAIDMLTIGLSKKVAAEGVSVNAVRPGFIYTDFHASSGKPGQVDRLKDAIPMKCGGQPEEVVQAILWLLSDSASYATGTFIDLGGGH